MKNDFVIYKFTGFCDFILTNDAIFNISDKVIKKVMIDKELTTLKIILKNECYLHENIEHLNLFAYKYFIKLLFNNDINKVNPTYELSDTYSSNKKPNYTITKTLSINSTYSITNIKKEENFYNDIFGSSSMKIFKRHDKIYKKIISILSVNNLVLQYQFLYELLMDILEHKNGIKRQRNVVDFIKNYKKKYNKPWIEFQKSRKNPKNDEDNFTFLRNLIYHAELSNNDKEFEDVLKSTNSKTIANLLVIISESIKVCLI